MIRTTRSPHAASNTLSSGYEVLNTNPLPLLHPTFAQMPCSPLHYTYNSFRYIRYSAGYSRFTPRRDRSNVNRSTETQLHPKTSRTHGMIQREPRFDNSEEKTDYYRSLLGRVYGSWGRFRLVRRHRAHLKEHLSKCQCFLAIFHCY